jgi:hypothetical protein
MNSKGLGDLGKHSYIAVSVRDHNLDFIAILEAGRRVFSVQVLNRLSDSFGFTCHCRPPHGRSDGILLGVNNSSMDVLALSDGEFHIKFHIRNKAGGRQIYMEFSSCVWCCPR